MLFRSQFSGKPAKASILLCANILWGTFVILLPLANDAAVSDELSAKAATPISSTVAGIVSVETPVPRKACPPIDFNEPFSGKVIRLR